MVEARRREWKHPDTAQSLNNLALLRYSQGDYDGARPLFERALAIHEKVLGAEHPSTAASLNNLDGRPCQLYIGPPKRDYVPVDQRSRLATSSSARTET
jgi:tetratricopeptide (TPR) repeat protein